MVPVSKINLTGVGFMDDRDFTLVHRQQEYFKDTVIAFTDQNYSYLTRILLIYCNLFLELY